MKKIALILIVALTYVSCQQDSTPKEINRSGQLIIDQSRAASISIPALCHATSSWNSTGFTFIYTDPAAWGNYIHIRPQLLNGDRGIGKMYVINAFTGAVFVPINHGVDLGPPEEYIFSVEGMQNTSGTVVAFCALNYLFN